MAKTSLLSVRLWLSWMASPSNTSRHTEKSGLKMCIRDSISYVIYLLLGLVGLPVFSGFSGGFTKLAGPTGGYLIGFLFMIPLTGILFEKTGKSFWKQFGAMVLGTLVCYLFGTVWLCLQLNLDFIGGLGAVSYTHLI